MISHDQVKKIIKEHLRKEVESGKLYISDTGILLQKNALARTVEKYTEAKLRSLKKEKVTELEGLNTLLRNTATGIEKSYITKIKTGKVTDEFLKLLRTYAKTYSQIKIHTNQIELLENVIIGDRSELEHVQLIPKETQTRRKPENRKKTLGVIVKKPIVVEIENEFVRKGDGWLIRFDKKEPFILPHFKGLTYIAYLILNERKDVHLNELINIEAGREDYYVKMDENIDKEKYFTGLNDSESWKLLTEDPKIPPSDRKAAKEYFKRSKELITQLERNVISKEEKDKILDEIETLTPLIIAFKKKYAISSDNDKNLKVGIKKAIKDVRDEHIRRFDPKLADHLEESIEYVGINAIYSPKSEYSWVVDPFEKKTTKKR